MKPGYQRLNCGNCLLMVDWPCRDYKAPVEKKCPECSKDLSLVKAWSKPWPVSGEGKLLFREDLNG